MKLTVLLLAIGWLNFASSRRLRESFNNDIDDENEDNSLNYNNNNNNNNNGRTKDWVRISRAPRTVVTAPIGTRVELECESIGSPAPSISWLKGNIPIIEVSFNKCLRLDPILMMHVKTLYQLP